MGNIVVAAEGGLFLHWHLQEVVAGLSPPTLKPDSHPIWRWCQFRLRHL